MWSIRPEGYRRLNQKTRNTHAATLFGTIELQVIPLPLLAS